jgi:hypothetical protein
MKFDNNMLQERRTIFKQLDVATIDLHALSTHWHIILIDMTECGKQLVFVQKWYNKYMEDVRHAADKWHVDPDSKNIQESLDAFSSRCNAYIGWINNYKERTNVRINLVSILMPSKASMVLNLGLTSPM